MHAILLGLTLLGSAPEAVHPAAGCPALFGDATTHVTNRQHRQQVLVSVAAGVSVVDVVHSAAYRRPVSATVDGLTLVATVKENGSWHARVGLSPDLAPGCEPGIYDVQVDDSIGPTRVLAIVESAVLLEDSQSKLAFLYVPGKQRPVWRLTWASPWLLRQGAPSPGAGGGAPPKIANPPPGYPSTVPSQLPK